MTNLTEANSFDAGIYQLETADPVQGGTGGIANTQAQSLVNRTRWLYNQVQSILTTIAGLPSTNSPAFTGTPTAPTPAAGDDSTTIATTAFVNRIDHGVVSVNVAGNSNVTLTAAQYGVKIINLTGALTGNIAVIFPNSGEWDIENSTSGAFTITCRTAAGTGVTVAQSKTRHVIADGTNVQLATSDFTDTALVGTPTAPTPTAGDNSTKVATTAFVQSAVGSGVTVSTSGLYQPNDYLVDTTAGVVVFQVAAAPAYGNAYTFTDPSNSWGIHKLTIDGNGHSVGTPTCGTFSTVDADASDLKFGIWFNGTYWELF